MMKNRILKKLTVVAIICALFFSTFVFSANAHYSAGGYSLYSITYRIVDSAGEDVWEEAAQNWVDAVGTGFRQSAYSLNQAHYGDLAYEWFGLYSPNDTPATYFHVYVNTQSIDNFADCDGHETECEISTATHEFGHAQFLADIKSGYGNRSIMSYERDRTTILTPQQHDIDDIESYRQNNLFKGTQQFYNPEPHADWPVYNFDEIIGDAAETVVLVEVTDVKPKQVGEGEPPAQLATLKVLETFYGSSDSEIILDQALDFVEPGESYIIFLKKKGDYYYEVSGESVIQEKNGVFTSKIPGFTGEFTKESFRSEFIEKVMR